MNKLTVACLILLLAGCSTKAMTPPRSEVIEEARKQGIELPSVEADREVFFSFEKDQRRRLLSLIERRSRDHGVDESYKIGPGDDLEINVFDVPELNVTARVRESGFISLPLVGAVQAAGRTEHEVLEDLRSRLGSFVRRPQVSLSITQYGSQKVNVLGAVSKPGTYPLKKGLNSFVELIGEAGGVNPRAGNFINFVPAEATGLRSGNDVETRARLALAASSGNKPAGIEIYLDEVMGTSGGIPVEIPIRGGDMIIVPEAGKIMVEGEVMKGGSFELGQQMTMLGALAAAGGITYGAKVDEVEIVREFSIDKKARLIVDLRKVAAGEGKDVRLRNGDILRVPSDSSRRFRQDTYEAIGRVINFGVGGSVNVVP